FAFIAAGLADLVMVLGVEKLNVPAGGEALLNMGTGVGREGGTAHGLTAPPGFAPAAPAHKAPDGATEEQPERARPEEHHPTPPAARPPAASSPPPSPRSCAPG